MANDSVDWVRRLDAVKDAKARDDVPFLIRALTDPDHRSRAADALADLGAVESADALLRLLNASDPYVRVSAVRALGKLHASDAASAVYDVARSDESGMVRHWAANALVDLDDPRAYQASIDLLGDSQPVVRANAAFTLGRLGNPCALPRLLAVRPRPWRAPLQWLAFRRVYRGAIGALRRRAAGKEPRAWSDARWFKGFRNAVFFLALAGVCVALGASADFWWGLLPLALVLLSWTVTAVMWMRGWH